MKFEVVVWSWNLKLKIFEVEIIWGWRNLKLNKFEVEKIEVEKIEVEEYWSWRNLKLKNRLGLRQNLWMCPSPQQG